MKDLIEIITKASLNSYFFLLDLKWSIVEFFYVNYSNECWFYIQLKIRVNYGILTSNRIWGELDVNLKFPVLILERKKFFGLICTEYSISFIKENQSRFES